MNEIESIVQRHPLGLRLISAELIDKRWQVTVQHEDACGETFIRSIDSFRSTNQKGSLPKLKRCPNCQTRSVAEAYVSCAISWMLGGGLKPQALVLDVVKAGHPAYAQVNGSEQVTKAWRYDGWIESHSILVEHHGSQHYDCDHPYWRNSAEDYSRGRERDRIKQELAIAAGKTYVVVRDLHARPKEWSLAVVEAMNAQCPGWDAAPKVAELRARLLAGEQPPKTHSLLTARCYQLRDAAAARRHRIVSVSVDRQRAVITCDCSEHLEWETSISNYMMGTGCPTCARISGASKRRLTVIEIEQKTRPLGWLPSFDEAEYLNRNQMLPWRCSHCGAVPARLNTYASISEGSVARCSCQQVARVATPKQIAVKKLGELSKSERLGDINALALVAKCDRQTLRRAAREAGFLDRLHPHTRWTEQEDQLLRQYWPNVDLAAQHVPSHSKKAIEIRSTLLGLPPRALGRPRNMLWTRQDHNKLRKLCGAGATAIAKKMGRKVHDVNRELRRLNLPTHNCSRAWCEDSRAIVAKLYPDGVDVVRQALVRAGYPDRSPKAVVGQMELLRKRGDVAYSNQTAKGRARAAHVSRNLLGSSDVLGAPKSL